MIFLANKIWVFLFKSNTCPSIKVTDNMHLLLLSTMLTHIPFLKVYLFILQFNTFSSFNLKKKLKKNNNDKKQREWDSPLVSSVKHFIKLCQGILVVLYIYSFSRTPVLTERCDTSSLLDKESWTPYHKVSFWRND